MQLYNEKKSWSIEPTIKQHEEMRKTHAMFATIKSKKHFLKKKTARAWIKKQPNILNYYIHNVFQKPYYVVYYCKLVRRH